MGTSIETEFKRTLRPDVLDRHKKFTENNERPGFVAALSTHHLPTGRHQLAVMAQKKSAETEIGRVWINIPKEEFQNPEQDNLYWQAEGILEKPASVLLMHIPKTAGTSLAAFLQTRFSKSQTALHIENQIHGKNRREVQDFVDKNLLSAHLKIDTIDRFIELRRFFMVTIFREPIAQTLSHLAWVKRLADPENGAQLKKRPEHIQRMVERLDQVDLVEFIDTMNERERNMFENCQTRYLLPFHGETVVADRHLEMAVFNLNRFNLVGITERFYDFLLLLSFYMGWEPPERMPRLNQSKKAYARDLDHADQAITSRLESLTHYDQILYRIANQMFESQFKNMVKLLDRELVEPILPTTLLTVLKNRANSD